MNETLVTILTDINYGSVALLTLLIILKTKHHVL